MNFTLVKLIKAVTSLDNTHCYEVITHSMSGVVKQEEIKEALKNQLYPKALKMTSGKNHAVRYLNSFTYTIISKEEYEVLLTKWEEKYENNH